MSEKSNNSKPFGVMALILGLASIALALIKCYGIFSFIPGILGVINGLIGLKHAKKENNPLGFFKVSIAIAIIGIGMGVSWAFYFVNIMNDGNDAKIKSDKGYQNSQVHVKSEPAKPIVNKPATDNKLDKQLKNYETLINKYISNSKKAKLGDVSALTECTSISVEASAISEELIKNASAFTNKQVKKFEELQKKYNAAVQTSEK